MPHKCLPLLRQQRTHYSGDIAAQYAEELQATYDSFKQFLPEGGRVLDIGCGMAGIDVLLARHYGDKAHLTLCDKQGVSPKINAGFHSRAEDFSSYHDFTAAAELLKANGVDCARFVDLQQESFPAERFDVAISLLSWGFHYPIATYQPNAKVIIADIRKGTDGEEQLKQYGNMYVVHDALKYRRVVVC